MAENQAPIKVPTSGYILFVSEASKYPEALKRAEDELRKDLASPDEKISKLKIFSTAWNMFTDEEKKTFNDRVAILKENNPQATQAESHLKSHKKSVGYPLARVKKIVKTDPEVNLLNAEAIIAITKAAELFVQDFTQSSHSIAKNMKRKVFNIEDMKRAAKFSEFQFVDYSNLIKDKSTEE